MDTIGKIIQPVQTTSYLNLFKEMMQAYTNPSPATPMLIKAQILSLLYHLYTDTVASVDAKLKNAYHGVLKKAITYMENNYQTDISVSDIAAHVDLSPNYFHKVFVSTMETTPLKYLTGLRVEHAKKLLCQSDMSIREISAECGFEHDAYFCQVFKKEAGITPAMYRKHYR